MDGGDTRTQAVQHLQTALDSDDTEEKEFHIREALQLLQVEENEE